MSIFDCPIEQRTVYVAKCLGYNDDEKTWDKEVIEHILYEVSKESHRAFMKILNNFTKFR